ncbi:MAG: glutaredoxin [Cyclobacteriaceae bacterium]|nr:glutaredoxin [Cyclobacteriaceae bacterium]MDH5249187.1 glutaredoxin [Cyclobacteriaceae bacterium]
MTPFFNSRELYLIYNPDAELDRKVHALAYSVNSVVHEIDVMRKTITPLHWKEILNLLHVGPSSLINNGHPDYNRLIAGKDFSEDDYLEVLFQNPQLVKGPIGVLHDRAVLCDDPNDILRLDDTPDAEQQL